MIAALAEAAPGVPARLYYAYSCAVVPGLQAAAEGEPQTAKVSMRDHVAIENPTFLATFLGTPSWTALALTTHAPRDWVAASPGLHAVTPGVASAPSVPLNDALASGGSREGSRRPGRRGRTSTPRPRSGAFACLAVALRG